MQECFQSQCDLFGLVVLNIVARIGDGDNLQS